MNSGIRQGWPLSPWLLVLAVDVLIRDLDHSAPAGTSARDYCRRRRNVLELLLVQEYLLLVLHQLTLVDILVVVMVQIDNGRHRRRRCRRRRDAVVVLDQKVDVVGG